MIDSYALLATFARLRGDDQFYDDLCTAIAEFKAWDTFIPLAEEHSLSPLVYHHLQQANAPIPADVKLKLQGLFLRHRQANQSMMVALENILTILNDHQIEAVVLKGAALANIVYPHIGLRPMRDLDILVPHTQAQKAQDLLQQSGFDAMGYVENLPGDHRHLDVLQETRNGRIVSVEIHYELLSGLMSAGSKNIETLKRPFLPFTTPTKQTAQTLHPDEMLWHLYQHMMSEVMRLIRIVDLVGFAETMQHEINWGYVHQVFPKIIEVLSLLHYVTPLSNSLREVAQIPLGKRPSGAKRPLHDWPPAPRSTWHNKSKKEIYQSTFFPSEFSLRMYYGIGAHRSAFWQRTIIHPAQIIRWYIARHR